MTKLMFTVVLLAMTCLSAHAFAKAQDKTDPYSQCVDETIQELKLGNINNAVVEICSTRAKTRYTKQIVQLLDQIKIQSKEYKQPERFHNVVISFRLLIFLALNFNLIQ